MMKSAPCSEKFKFVCKRTDEFFDYQDKLEAEESEKLTEQEKEIIKTLLEEQDDKNGKAPMLARGRFNDFRVAVPFLDLYG